MPQTSTTFRTIIHIVSAGRKSMWRLTSSFKADDSATAVPDLSTFSGSRHIHQRENHYSARKLVCVESHDQLLEGDDGCVFGPVRPRSQRPEFSQALRREQQPQGC